MKEYEARFWTLSEWSAYQPQMLLDAQALAGWWPLYRTPSWCGLGVAHG